ncbi:MAG: TRAP transporter large permease [Rhodospirillales bacterium]|jgi:tripartite ATP-independent transporter DctM subunit
MGEVLSALMFVATILVVLAGYPVAFTLAGTALAFGALGIGLGLFEPSLLTALAARYFGTMTNEILVAVPLFVFMGVMLERSKIAEQLLMTMGELFGAIRGGLGLSVILVGALLAASTGIVGATVVTMGLLSLPAMTRAGYDPKLASGAICASGTLGQIIPPSTVLIFMGDILQGANQAAQLEMGNFSPEPLSVGQLFAGAMLPGLVLVTLYMLWIIFKAITDPESCPALELDPAQRATLHRRVFGALVPPLVLILAVLGSILTGIATPTESASVGAVGSMILAAFKGRLKGPVLKEVMRSTLMISSMVFVILLGASVFSLVFRGLGGDDLVFDILTAMPGGTAGAVFVVMLVIFFLGFFLDTFEIIFITVPIAAPVLIRLGVDPVWLGVLIGMNLQTSFLTPPFGFALFYLRGVADSAIKTLDIYKGALPFVGLQVAGIGLLWLVPELATWLPDVLFNNAGFALPTETINSIPIQATGVIDQFDNLLSDQPNGKVMKIDSFENLLPE